MKLCFRSAKLTKKCSIPSQTIKCNAMNEKKNMLEKKRSRNYFTGTNRSFIQDMKDTECGKQHTKEYLGYCSFFVYFICVHPSLCIKVQNPFENK